MVESPKRFDALVVATTCVACNGRTSVITAGKMLSERSVLNVFALVIHLGSAAWRSERRQVHTVV